MTICSRQLRRFYKHSAIVLLNTVLALCAFNVACYVIVRIRQTRSGNMVAQRHGAPRLRHVYPDLDEKSINELLQETWGRRESFEPYTQFRESPRRGKFVNVHEAGFRFSKRQGPWPPEKDAYTVFIFGGSTTFSYGLTDSQTVTSYLQESLAARMNRTIYVYNFGAGSYQSSQERIRFQELLIKGLRPQMAIFIDGLNEYAFRHVPNYTDDLRRLVDQHSILSELVKAMPMTQLASQLRGNLDRLRERKPTDARSIDRPENGLLDSVAKRYFSNKKQIEVISKAYDIQPVFVWQPIPFYKCDTSNQLFPDFTGTNRYARAGYEYMRSIAETEAQGADFLWCADMQQQVAEPLYVDSVHYTATMSERLAKQIIQLLAERNLLVRATGVHVVAGN